MTLARPLRDAAAAYALSLIGQTRDRLPVPWTASAVMDDCAAFCSHVLWNGKPGPILWVDGFKSAGDGSYGGGSTDLQPWDVLLFDWEPNGVGNHVEFMIADLGNGTVRTYGANGSDTRAAAYRIRPKRYIMGRFRPAWGVFSAPIDHATITPPKEYRDMYSLIPIAEKNGGYKVVSLTTGKYLHVKNTYHLTLLDRIKKNDGTDQMLVAELDLIRDTYLKRLG